MPGGHRRQWLVGKVERANVALNGAARNEREGDWSTVASTNDRARFVHGTKPIGIKQRTPTAVVRIRCGQGNELGRNLGMPFQMIAEIGCFDGTYGEAWLAAAMTAARADEACGMGRENVGELLVNLGEQLAVGRQSLLRAHELGADGTVGAADAAGR